MCVLFLVVGWALREPILNRDRGALESGPSAVRRLGCTCKGVKFASGVINKATKDTLIGPGEVA